MLLRLFTSFFLLACFICVPDCYIYANSQIDLTNKEREWLSQHSPLKIGVGQAFPPFMWIDKTTEEPNFKGLVSDYIELLSEKLDVKVEVILDKPFKEQLEMARFGKVDLFPLLAYTSERSEYLAFTDPYLSYPMVIITRSDSSPVKNIVDLSGKRIAVVKHLVIYDKLLQEYSNLDLDYIFTKTVDENLELIATGGADACIINLAVASAYIHKKGLTNLKIATEVDWQAITYSMAIRSDAPILKSIIDKALLSITSKEKEEISKRWIKVEYDPGFPLNKILLWSFIVSLVVILIFLVIYIWNRQLKKEILERKKVEKNLRKAQDIARLGNWEMDVTSEWIRWSDVNFKIFGIEPSKESGLTFDQFMKLVHPEDHKLIYKLWETLTTEGHASFEYRIIGPDGVTRWINGRGKSYFDEKGSPVKMFGTLQDITDLKQTEKKLEEIFKLNELMLNSLPHPTMLINKDRTVLAANKVALDAGVEVGRFCWDTFGHRDCISEEHKQRLKKDPNGHKDDILCTFCLANDLLKSGVPQHNPEVFAFDKLWDTWWVPVDEDTYLHYAIDITERKHAEKLLEKEAERSKTLLELYQQAPKFSDKELYQYTLDKAIELTDSKIGFFHQVSEDQESIILDTWNSETLKVCEAEHGTHYLIEKAGNWVDCLHTEEPVVYNEFSLSPNQKGLPVGHVSIDRFMSVPVKIENKIKYIFGVGNKPFDYQENDITQIQLVANELCSIISQRNSEKAIEKIQAQLLQAQKMEAIGTLAGGIAHDFNNVLSSIIGFSELALGGVDKGSELEDDINEVLQAGLRAKDLINQILTFARQSEVTQKPVQVKKVIKETIQFLNSSIPSTIEIQENLNSNSCIFGSATQIHQILMNLCTNSSHAMGSTGGILEITTEDVKIDKRSPNIQLNSGNYVKITVKDTGDGISPEIQKNIFDPYFTTKDIGEGTGMGLAVVHGIVDSYNGHITVESALGVGTTFTVFLPIFMDHTDNVSLEKSTLPSGSEHLLIVDDERPILKYISRLCEDLGYVVTSVNSSMNALEAFKEEPDKFDLILTDMTMPEMTGEKLAVEIMEIRPEIPVILCTGYSKYISKNRATDIGIKDFLLKPIDKAELAKSIRNLLDNI